MLVPTQKISILVMVLREAGFLMPSSALMTDKNPNDKHID